MSLAPAGHVWPQSGWHYRRSLASRVILLTTIAVGLAVALVALAVFLTVRIQMQASLDDSLLDRAKRAAETNVLPDVLAADRLPVVGVRRGRRPDRGRHQPRARSRPSTRGRASAWARRSSTWRPATSPQSIRTIVAGDHALPGRDRARRSSRTSRWSWPSPSARRRRCSSGWAR